MMANISDVSVKLGFTVIVTSFERILADNNCCGLL